MRIDQEYAVVPIDEIEPHPDNPNKGNIPMIRESIQANDWYGACIVQRREGGPHRIIAGEHRWRAAKAEGATEIAVLIRDMDDATALRIMIVDNESARAGAWDEEALQTVLAQLGDVEDGLWGTGIDLERLKDFDKAVDDEETMPPMPDDDFYDQQWGVIVVCENEEEQKAVYDELTAAGRKVRVVTV